MAVWHGSNWQLTGHADQLSSIGVGISYGLLDEPIATAGTLSAVLGALHAELARPVELSPGQVVIPEVSSRAGSDTATLEVRGRRETVRAAFGRLPEFFRQGLLPAGGEPGEVETPPWPADLVVRTGRNAAILGGFRIRPAQPESAARELLALLDPAAGRTRSVFFTDDPELVGEVYPVATATLTPARAAWADGTALRTRTANEDRLMPRVNPLEVAARDNSAGVVHGNNSPVLFSLLVPRSACGYLAAQVLNRQLSHRLSAQLGNTVATAVDLTGMGVDFCATFRSEVMLDTGQRLALHADLALSLGQIPESWISDVPGRDAVAQSELMQRERVLAGLEASEPPLNAMILEVISQATASLHAAVDPEAGAKPRRRQQSARDEGAYPAIQELRLPAPRRVRYFKSWAPRGFNGAPLAAIPGINVGRRSIQADYWQRYRIPGPTAGLAADLGDLLAVLEDQHSNLFILDAKMRMLRVYPSLYYSPGRLRHLIQERTQGAPWLSITSGLSIEQVEKWSAKRRRKLATLAGVAALFIGIWAALIATGQQAAEPVTERINISETATLANGSTITATRFDVQYPTEERQEYSVNVEVNFCAGGDTRIEDFAADAQRMISPADFAMYNDSYAQARLVDSPNQLREQTLAPGQCVIGNLVFRDRMLAVPRLAYENAVGDDVVWYSYGRVPEQFQ